MSTHHIEYCIFLCAFSITCLWRIFTIVRIRPIGGGFGTRLNFTSGMSQVNMIIANAIIYVIAKSVTDHDLIKFDADKGSLWTKIRLIPRNIDHQGEEFFGRSTVRVDSLNTTSLRKHNMRAWYQVF